MARKTSQVAGILLFVSLILGHRVLEALSIGIGAANLGFCILVGVVGAVWPLAGIAGVFGSTMVGEGSVVLGGSVSLWLRAALAARLIWDLFGGRVQTSGIRDSTFRRWLPFVVVVFASFLVNGSTAGVPFLLKFSLTAIFVAACVAYLPDLRSLEVLQTGLVFMGLVSAAWGILGLVRTGVRSGGLLDNPNYGAVYLCVAFVLALGMLGRQGLAKGLSWPAVVVIPLAILASGSRGGTVVLLAGTFAYVALAPSAQSPKRFLVVGAVLAAVGFLASRLLSGSEPIARIMGFGQTILHGELADPAKGNGFDRIPLWRDSIRIWLAHPIFGVGPQNWFAARLTVSPNAVTETPHMYIGQILAELGTFGGLAYFSFITVGFVRATRQLRRTVSPLDEVPPAWVAASFAMAAATFSGSAYDPVLHALLVVGTSCPWLARDLSLGTADGQFVSELEASVIYGN